MSLEILALITAAVLILIDYKLKQDLIKLFERIESGIEAANRLHTQDSRINTDTGNIPSGSMVGDNPGMETAASDAANSPNGASRKTANKRTPANGSRGTRNQAVSESGE